MFACFPRHVYVCMLHLRAQSKPAEERGGGGLLWRGGDRAADGAWHGMLAARLPALRRLVRYCRGPADSRVGERGASGEQGASAHVPCGVGAQPAPECVPGVLSAAGCMHHTRARSPPAGHSSAGGGESKEEHRVGPARVDAVSADEVLECLNVVGLVCTPLPAARRLLLAP